MLLKDQESRELECFLFSVFVTLTTPEQQVELDGTKGTSRSFLGGSVKLRDYPE